MGAAAALLATVLVRTPAHATPGELDPAFNGGKATFALREGGNDGAFSVALQPDGK